ncbi:MAG TPA: hypothetical protein VFH66_03050 [Mycobacteriales bacterium]|nr:hypothetical protein [Mycobacteriales bacterium]
MNDQELRRAEHAARAIELGLHLPPDAAISHESAAILRGWSTYDVPAAVRVTRTRGNGFRTSDIHVHRAGMRPTDRDVAQGVPVTSAARTVIDLGRRLPFGQALVTADAALRAGTSRQQLQDVLRHQWTWPMVRRAMPVMRWADSRSESALESWTRSRFITLRLPIPRLQQDIVGEHGWVARVDFLFDEYDVAGEADGRIKYLADELWAEKQRQDDIEDAGKEVIRWIWRTAHVPDEEFARRLLRKLDRGLMLKRLRATA